MRAAKLAAVVVATAGLMAAGPATVTANPPETGGWPTDFHAWTSYGDFVRGTSDGVLLTTAGDGALTLDRGATVGTWTSPWYSPSAGFTAAVPSWQVNTPSGSWIEVGLQARTATTESMWFAMGSWAFDTSVIERQSVDGQVDAVGRIFTDTFVARPAPPGGQPTGYRLRVTMHGTDTANPVVRQLAATASVPGELPATSQPLAREAVELAVPPYSQSTHSGEYPDFGGGGQVWCSPTSTSMVVSYWGTGPTAADIASLPPDRVFDRNGRADGQVDWTALHTWDYVYEGAGNWPFNTAYASEYGLDGSVRQYSTLRAVESWVRRGVPVVISINFDNTDKDPTNDLDGSSIRSTGGHLMLVVGFTETGAPIVNDPASPSNEAVRHVYRRDQFERNWLRASDGTTYVIKPNNIRG